MKIENYVYVPTNICAVFRIGQVNISNAYDLVNSLYQKLLIELVVNMFMC